MDIIQDQSIRLNKLIEALGKTQTEFSDDIDVSQPFVNQILRGKAKMSSKVINNIMKAYSHVNIEWLLRGDGEMFFSVGKGEVSEPEVEYKPSNWVKELAEILNRHEDQIGKLEREVEELHRIIMDRKT